MGIGSWLRSLGGTTPQGPRQKASGKRSASPRVKVVASFSIAEPTGMVQVAGTSTFAKDAVRDLTDRHQLGERDVLELQATLRRYPEHGNAVNVLVDDVKVGALSQAHSQAMTMGLGDELTVPYQLHVFRTTKGLSAVAYIWLGRGKPRWEFTRDNPAPLTNTERAVHSQQGHTRMIDEALADVLRAPKITAGMVKGYHYTEMAEPIKQLKREGRLQDALVLCYQAIGATEKEARATGWSPAPAYTIHAAVIHRKLGQRDEERAVLERWMDATPVDQREGSKVAERLAKLSG